MGLTGQHMRKALADLLCGLYLVWTAHRVSRGFAGCWRWLPLLAQGFGLGGMQRAPAAAARTLGAQTPWSVFAPSVHAATTPIVTGAALPQAGPLQRAGASPQLYAGGHC